MKHPILTLLSPALAFGLAALNLHAQTPAGGDPFVKGSPAAAGAAKAKAKEPDLLDSLFVMDVYSLDKNDAAAVLDSERGSAARYRRVTDLASAGKARLEILTALTTKPGVRAQSESTDEVRFASEFYQASHKNGMPNPTGWIARKAGDTLQFEMAIRSDGRTCDLNLTPSRVRLAGYRDIAAIAGDSVVTQPQFDSQNIISSISVTDGEPLYAGSFSPPTPLGIANGGAASPVWLAFIHINILKLATDGAKPPARLADSSSVNLEYSCYSLDSARARDILLEPGALDAPWEKVQALLGKKEARLEHILALRTMSGQRAAMDETHELRYATRYSVEEWNGATQKNHRATTAGPAREKQDETPKKEGEKSATITETIETNHTAPDSEMTPSAPLSFEVRNLGVSIEAEPVVSADGLTVDLNHVLQSVTYLGDLKTPGAGARYPAQPIFQTRKLTTSQMVPMGRRVLVGTLNPPASDGVSDHVDAGRIFLVFLRATPNEP